MGYIQSERVYLATTTRFVPQSSTSDGGLRMTTKLRTYGRIDQPTIPALGKLSEEYEAAEEAHGSLHGFHRLCSTADSTPSKAVYLLAPHRGTTNSPNKSNASSSAAMCSVGGEAVKLSRSSGSFAYFQALGGRSPSAPGRRVCHAHETSMKDSWRTHGRAGHEEEP